MGKISDMEVKVRDDLKELVNVRLCAKSMVNDGWEHDLWSVQLGKGKNIDRIDYRTGIGHRTKLGQPKPPDILNIFENILSDMGAENESFNDWAENFGYSSDSIKAFDVYRACLETGKIVRKHIPCDLLKQIETVIEEKNNGNDCLD